MGLGSLDRQRVQFEPATCPSNKPKHVHSGLRWWEHSHQAQGRNPPLPCRICEPSRTRRLWHTGQSPMEDYWWLEQRSLPDLTMFSNSPKGRCKENTVSLFLKGQQYDKNKEAATMKIQIINKENILHQVVKHGNRGLTKLWSLHRCRHSKPNRMWSSATCLKWPCSKEETGLDNCSCFPAWIIPENYVSGWKKPDSWSKEARRTRNGIRG